MLSFWDRVSRFLSPSASNAANEVEITLENGWLFIIYMYPDGRMFGVSEEHLMTKGHVGFVLPWRRR